MIKRFVVLLFCSLVLSCKTDQPPIGQEKMQQVLTDIQLAESYSSLVKKDTIRRRVEKNLDSLAVYYLTIFKHHKISPKDFSKSLDWYKQHPEELDSVYTRMIPKFSEWEALYGKPGKPIAAEPEH